jgi:hypothetical protein
VTDLEIVGLSRWMPLDLGADTETYAAELAATYPRTPAVDLVAAGVAGMAARFTEARAEADRSGDSVLVAAWLFLHADDDLRPIAHATLQGVRVPAADLDVPGVVRLLTEDEELYQDPEVRPVQTASGPATFLRYRPVVRDGGEREVHERSVVFWLRPEQDMAVLLSAYTDDLVGGAEVADALEQLSEGVTGA